MNPSKTFSLELVTKQLLHGFCKMLAILIRNNKEARLVNIPNPFDIPSVSFCILVRLGRKFKTIKRTFESCDLKR